MIDLHCHILPLVDDGSDSMEESLAMARIAVDNGTTELVATPHYIEGSGSLGVAAIKERLDEFKMELSKRDIPLTLHQGNEIYLSTNIHRLIKEGEASTIAGTRYLLLEMPFFDLPHFAETLVHDLMLSGYIPIIVHPERNRIMANDPNRLLDFLNLGALAQINGDSLLGRNGKVAKKAAETMLTCKMVHFIASDCHHKDRRRPNLSKAKRAAEHLVGKKEAQRLLEGNPLLILQNKKLQIDTPIRCRVKKSMFSLFKR